MVDELVVKRFTDEYLSLRDSEKSNFSRVCNRFLSETFLIKGKERDYEDFFFALGKFQLISDYFSVLDYEVLRDDSKGIIYIHTTAERNRVRLSKLETIILLILRIEYYKRSKVLSETDKIIMSLEELQDEVNKTSIYSSQKRLMEYEVAFRNLRTSKLIDFTKTHLDADTRFEILPSIMIVISNNDLDNLNKALKGYVESSDEDEDINED